MTGLEDACLRIDRLDLSEAFPWDTHCESCDAINPYDPNNSSTSADLRQSFELVYGSETEWGERFTDTIGISGMIVR